MASHIGKLPIEIPAGVEVTINGQEFAAKGAKGSDSYTIPEGVTAKVEGNEIIVTANDDLRPTRAKHGLARSIVASMVKGVHDGYSKSLDIVGTGYRAQMRQGHRVLARLLPHHHREPAGRHHPRTAEPEPGHREGYRQAGRWPGCREHS